MDVNTTAADLIPHRVGDKINTNIGLKPLQRCLTSCTFLFETIRGAKTICRSVNYLNDKMPKSKVTETKPFYCDNKTLSPSIRLIYSSTNCRRTPYSLKQKITTRKATQ